jgi:hypothetical protein
MKKNKNNSRNGRKKHKPRVRVVCDTYIETNLCEFAAYAMEHDRTIVNEEDLFTLNAIANDYRAGVKIPKSRHLEAERAKQRALDGIKARIIKRTQDNVLHGDSAH